MLQGKKAWVFLLPTLVGISIFYIVPYVWGLFYAVTEVSPSGIEFVFLEHFKGVLSNEVFWLAFRNTILFTLLSVGLSVLLSFAAAVFIQSAARRSGLIKNIRNFIHLPIAVPVVSVSVVWLSLFTYEGYLNNIIIKIFNSGNINWLDGWAVYVPVLTLFIWKYSGFYYFTSYAEEKRYGII